MKKISTFWIVVSLQILLLLGIVLRYEYIRFSGFTAYIKAEGYDPIDLFRGDYVDVRYSLPVPSEFTPLVEASNNSFLYIVPKIDNNRIIGIQNISKSTPKNEVFFKINNVWTQKSQKFQIIVGSGSSLDFTNTWCEKAGTYTQGGKLLYQDFDGRISSISPYLSENLNSGMKEGRIATMQACETSISLSTNQTSRYYVREKRGGELERKIRTGTMYAKWKIGKNGFILLEDIVEEKDIIIHSVK